MPSDIAINPSFGVWDANCAADCEQWIAHWKSWPTREVAAHPAYVQLFATAPHQRPLAAYWTSAAGCVLYPFVLRDLSEERNWPAAIGSRADITSPYGYGGPFCWGDNSSAVAVPFWREFDEWAAKQGVVSEFVRFSLFEDMLLAYPGRRVAKLSNIVCDLTGEKHALWESVKPKVRRNVKKAMRENVAVVCDESGESAGEFQRLYAATMDRRQADRGYYFPSSFFEQLQAGLCGQFAYFHARCGGKTISTELLLISAENVYFFLGGTDSEYYSLRPNDLLKYEIMLWAQERGKRCYVLGGGYAEQDGIFQYKLSFAPDGLKTFHVGQRVFDSAAYNTLVSHRKPATGNDPDFFPAYRAA